jgi:hypothetical protein
MFVQSFYVIVFWLALLSLPAAILSVALSLVLCASSPNRNWSHRLTPFAPTLFGGLILILAFAFEQGPHSPFAAPVWFMPALWILLFLSAVGAVIAYRAHFDFRAAVRWALLSWSILGLGGLCLAWILQTGDYLL